MGFTNLFPLPLDASAHGYKIDFLIYMVHILMILLFVGWGVFFIITLVRFNRRSAPTANYKGTHSKVTTMIEVAVVIFEAVLLVGLSLPFWSRYIDAFPREDNVVKVRVVAEQFAWNVHYPGPDGIFGRTTLEAFNKETNPLGIDPEDPNGKDDVVTINQLHLPIGRPALIRLSSKDVMHSFSLPVMRVKQDVIPGMEIPVWFTPTKTGEFEIACAQLCGLGHYRMRGFLTIHTEEGFQTWLSNQASAAGGDENYDDFWN